MEEMRFECSVRQTTDSVIVPVIVNDVFRVFLNLFKIWGRLYSSIKTLVWFLFSTSGCIFQLYNSSIKTESLTRFLYMEHPATDCQIFFWR